MRHDDLGQYDFMAPINRELNAAYDSGRVWLDATSQVQDAVRNSIGRRIQSIIREELSAPRKR